MITADLSLGRPSPASLETVTANVYSAPFVSSTQLTFAIVSFAKVPFARNEDTPIDAFHTNACGDKIAVLDS